MRGVRMKEVLHARAKAEAAGEGTFAAVRSRTSLSWQEKLLRVAHAYIAAMSSPHTKQDAAQLLQELRITVQCCERATPSRGAQSALVDKIVERSEFWEKEVIRDGASKASRHDAMSRQLECLVIRDLVEKSWAT